MEMLFSSSSGCARGFNRVTSNNTRQRPPYIICAGSKKGLRRLISRWLIRFLCRIVRGSHMNVALGATFLYRLVS